MPTARVKMTDDVKHGVTYSAANGGITGGIFESSISNDLIIGLQHWLGGCMEVHSQLLPDMVGWAFSLIPNLGFWWSF